MKKYIITLVILVIVMAGCSGSSDLSRSSAEKKFRATHYSKVFIKVRTTASSKDGKLLLKNGLAKETRGFIFGERAQPNAKLNPYFVKTKETMDPCVSFHILLYGEITKVKATGITKTTDSTCNVEYLLNIKPNDVVGRLFGNKKVIPIITEFQLYDDGWRFKDFLWPEINALSVWNKQYLYAFSIK